jgi:hypothetical protein
MKEGDEGNVDTEKIFSSRGDFGEGFTECK